MKTWKEHKAQNCLGGSLDQRNQTDHIKGKTIASDVKNDQDPEYLNLAGCCCPSDRREMKDCVYAKNCKDCQDDRVQQFRNLLSTQYGSFYIFALRRTRNKHLAEEVTQESFYLAAKNLGNLKDIQKLEAWIYAIFRNRSLLALKQAYRESIRKLPLQDIPLSGDSRLMRIQHGNDPAKLFEYAELKRQLEKEINALSPGDKEIIVRRIGFNETYKSIQQELQIPESSLRSRVSRIRLRLRKALAPN